MPRYRVKVTSDVYRLRVGKAELGRRLGRHLSQVDRLLDLRHASQLDQLEMALRALAKRSR
jgi:antitoxin HicB